MSRAQTPQLYALAAVEGDTARAATPQLAALVAVGGVPFARGNNTSQLPVLVVTEQEQSAFGSRTPQLPTLVVYATGAIERFNSRAWVFKKDGHPYYVLHLGVEGTFVYDKLTDKWSNWETAGYGQWNMENGWTFDTDQVIAADNQNPIIWKYDPETFQDEEFRTIERAVTGLIALRRRDTLSILGLHLTASVGSGVEDGATLRLRFSDDQGKTWSAWYSLALQEGDFDQVLNLRSLGTAHAPGRVFEIEDYGGLVRIDGADLDTDQDG